MKFYDYDSFNKIFTYIVDELIIQENYCIPCVSSLFNFDLFNAVRC